jgi:hypothetical protein
MHWEIVSKGDVRCRALADRHYSRQTPGHPMFTRPGYNMVLWCKGPKGEAVWVWFRPKWESGIKGTERKDKLRAVECTLFRNESGILSSTLIQEACKLLLTWDKLTVDWPDGAITGIREDVTARYRSKRAHPGQCYIHAGWKPFEHNTSERATHWLRLLPEEFIS